MDSTEAGDAKAGSTVRVDLMQELDGKVRMHICEGEPNAEGWTTAKFLACHSGQCGFCGDCIKWFRMHKPLGEVLLASQREKQRCDFEATLSAEHLACTTEREAREATEREISELEHELERELACIQEGQRLAAESSSCSRNEEDTAAPTRLSAKVLKVARQACIELDNAMVGVEQAFARGKILSPQQQRRVQVLKEEAARFKQRVQQ